MPFVLETNIEFLRLPAPWLVVLVIVPGVIGFAWWLYSREAKTASSGIKRTLAVLRAVTILGFLALLAEPVRQQFDETTIKPLVGVLLDDSYSMSAQESYRDSSAARGLRQLTQLPSHRPLENVSRAELVTRALESGDRQLIEELEERFSLELFRFANDLQPLSASEKLQLSADGQSTRIGTAIEQALGDVGREFVALVLVTDGRSNGGTDPLEAAAQARGSEVRLYPIGVGEPELLSRNAGIAWGLFPDSALVNQEVEFRVEVATSGFDPNQIATLVLIDQQDGTELVRESIAVDGPEPRQSRHFLSFQPTRPGKYEIVARIEPPEGDENPIDDETPPQTLWVKTAKIKVLYVEGYPRWEYRYLKNALIRANDTLSTQCLLLTADLRFEQERSPDLATQPLHQFPTDPKELFEYDVIIFGDVDPEQLHDDPAERQQILKDVKKFVEIGGGFLMIAGESYAPRSYVNTPIEDILPVVIRNLDREQTHHGPARFDRPFRPQLENPYDPHEIVKLRSNLEENRKLWESDEYGLPGLYWYVPVERAKPGARVLARHPEHGNPRYGKHPLIATTHYPTGRTLFIAFDSTWLWRKYYGERYHEQFWLKSIQYLAMNKLRRSNKRYELTTKDNRSEYDIKEPITLWASVRDEDYEPLEAPSQKVWLQTPKGKLTELELPAVPGETGVFEREIGEKEPGKYEAWIEGPSGSGGTVEKISHISFFVKVPVLETQVTSLDEDRLTEIASLSKGAYLRLHELSRLPELIEGEPVTKQNLRSEEELWDQSWILVALAGLLGFEWLVRKKFQLV